MPIISPLPSLPSPPSLSRSFRSSLSSLSLLLFLSFFSFFSFLSFLSFLSFFVTTMADRLTDGETSSLPRLIDWLTAKQPGHGVKKKSMDYFPTYSLVYRRRGNGH